MFDPAGLGEKKDPGLRTAWIVQIGSIVFFIDANSGSVLHKYRDLPQLVSFGVRDYQGALLVPTQVLIEVPPAIAPQNPAAQPVPDEATRAFTNAVAARSFFQYH